MRLPRVPSILLALAAAAGGAADAHAQFLHVITLPGLSPDPHPFHRLHLNAPGTRGALAHGVWTAPTSFASSPNESDLFFNISPDGAFLLGYFQGQASRRDASSFGPLPLPVPEGFGSLNFTTTASSADNAVIVGYGSGSLSGVLACRWVSAGGGPLTFELLPGMTTAVDCSADGDTLVGTGSAMAPARWTSAGGAAPLLDNGTPLGIEAVIHAVSADGGTIVGTRAEPSRPYKWTSAGGVQPFPLPTGAAPNAHVYALDVSADGARTVGYALTTEYEPLIWTDAGPPLRLENVLTAMGDTAHLAYQLLTVERISADGLTVSGFCLTNTPPFTPGVFIARISATPPTCRADLGVQGGAPGQDQLLNNNDFVAFISLFFSHDPRADLGIQGGTFGHDTLFDNNDFVVFITEFFGGCP